MKNSIVDSRWKHKLKDAIVPQWFLKTKFLLSAGELNDVCENMLHMFCFMMRMRKERKEENNVLEPEWRPTTPSAVPDMYLYTLDKIKEFEPNKNILLVFKYFRCSHFRCRFQAMLVVMHTGKWDPNPNTCIIL